MCCVMPIFARLFQSFGRWEFIPGITPVSRSLSLSLLEWTAAHHHWGEQLVGSIWYNCLKWTLPPQGTKSLGGIAAFLFWLKSPSFLWAVSGSYVCYGDHMLSLEPVPGLDSLSVKQYTFSPADVSRWHPHLSSAGWLAAKEINFSCSLTEQSSMGPKDQALPICSFPSLCGQASLSNIAAPHARVYDLHRIIELFRLEKPLKIIKSNH